MADSDQFTMSDPKSQRRLEKLLASLGIPTDAATVTITLVEGGEHSVTWSAEAPRRTTRRRASGAKPK